MVNLAAQEVEREHKDEVTVDDPNKDKGKLLSNTPPSVFCYC